MIRGLHLLIFAGLLSLPLLLPRPLSGQIGLEEVTKLRFQGNREFSDEALAGAIITRETECRSFIFLPFCLAGADFSLDPYFLSDREFRRDHARVRLFYYLRGYRETTVDTVLTRTEEDEVEITFQVEEGEPIRVTEIEFRAMEELPDSSVLEDLPIREGEPLSLMAIDLTRDTLETRLRNEGFAKAYVLRTVIIPRETPYEAQVSFDVWPGPLTYFGPLTVDVSATEGREPTVEETVVRRMLPFREGDVYQEDLRFDGQRNLYNLDLFRQVEVEPDTLYPVDSILPLSIQLVEDDIHQVRTGGGLSTAECFNFEARWASRNFFGGARRLQVTGRVANIFASDLKETPFCSEAGTGRWGDRTGSVSMDFTQPWLFSPRNSISTSLYAERQSIPELFVRVGVGASLAFTRTIARSTLLAFSYRPQLSSLDAAEFFFCSAYLICSPEEIDVLQEANRLSPVGVSLSRDRRNQVLSPTRGYSALLDMEHADSWTGSEFRYTRIVSEATWHTQGRGRWVLGARIRGGWVRSLGFRDLEGDGASREIIYPEKRLFAGGANSVRGFAQNRLGPRVLYLQDVKRLTGTETDPGPCTAEEVADLSCDAGEVEDGAFSPRPTGGTRLLEGSLELRFPVSGRLWEGATFLDFGQVWAEDTTPDFGDLEVTPGLGVRYFSPIGPIRVDVGYRFGKGDDLFVVTSQVEPNPDDPFNPFVRDDLVVLDTPVLFGEGIGSWDLRRFQLHLSIGQAF